jgi:lysophospholipase L1-like esterase
MIRGSRTALVLLAALAFAPAGMVSRANADDTNGVHYYVSLGDSFSVGTQPLGQPPNIDVETDQGYADQLYRLLDDNDPKLRLVKLGCGGESTRSMRFGSVDPNEGFSCGPPDFYLHRYPHKTQLAEAVAFLHAHQSHVSLVTIDIGGNDVLGGGGVPQVEANLPVILAELREAVGPSVPIVGMTYYDPFLAEIWFGTFDLGALQDEANSHDFNGALERIYGAFGDPVAAVDLAFSNNDTTIQPDGLPLDVQRICEWTWTCVAADIHPNDTGYGVMAYAFLAALP